MSILVQRCAFNKNGPRFSSKRTSFRMIAYKNTQATITTHAGLRAHRWLKSQPNHNPTYQLHRATLLVQSSTIYKSSLLSTNHLEQYLLDRPSHARTSSCPASQKEATRIYVYERRCCCYCSACIRVYTNTNERRLGVCIDPSRLGSICTF